MRIIHFSDFHLDGEHKETAKKIVLRLTKALVDIHSKKPIDLILFTGDMVFKGGKGFPSLTEAFKTFENIVINQIVEALHLPHNRFIFTLGNHDVNTTLVEKNENKKLRKSLISHAAVENYMYSPDLNLPQISEFNNFRDSYWKKYNCENEYKVEVKSKKFQYYVKLDINGMKVGINCLNTAWRCSGTKNDKDYLLLGKSQITRQHDFLDDCELKFSMGHHDPNRMQEFEIITLKEVLASNFDAYFCGDAHNFFAEHIKLPQGNCFYFTSPGTLYSNISEVDKYRNGFLLIDYDLDEGVIKVRHYYQNDNENFEINTRYGNLGVFETPIPESTLIKPMNTSLLRLNMNGEFIRNNVIDDCISKINDDNIKTIQLVALSSLGKTRILREAFKDANKCLNYYYCAYLGNRNDLKNLDEIFSHHQTQKGLIVLDNCPNDLFKEAVKIRDSYGSQFRLIGVNNDCYSDRNMGGLGVHLIVLKPDEMLDEVNNFIDRNIPISNGDMSARDNIKKIAGGFPGMAIRLVDNYKKEGDVNIHSVDDLMEKLLNFEKGHEEEQLKVLCTLSLFQPFPYGNEEAFTLIRENENITAIYGKGHNEIRDIFHRTITRFRELIEICGSWLTVRPFPLAIWLVSKWFENVYKERMEEMVNDIQKLESPLQEIIRDGLCKRLEYMQDSSQAQELIQRLTIGNNAPFCNEKVISSDLGSQLFLAMSSVNPGPVAECLNKVLMTKQIDWIRENIQGNVRRNLVWALEKLCFSNESYNLAVQVLALLAVAENETWANNATGQLLQLFHIRLPGTEASLKQRMETLKYLKDSEISYQHITIECIDRAFDNTTFYRDGSCSKFGIKTKEDYVPKSYKEIIEYWEYCRDILLEMLEMTPTILDKVAKIAVSHVIKWAIDGMLERMFPLFLKISVMKDNTWEEIYTTIKLIKRDRIKFYSQEFLKRFDEFCLKIRPNTFCWKLKDVRLNLQIDSSMSRQDTLEYEKKQYGLLAKEFIDDGIYASYEEIKEIALDKEYHDIWFSQALGEIIKDEQLRKLLKIFLRLISENEGDGFKSSFVFKVCYIFRERKATNDFIQEVYLNGYYGLYVKLLAHCETISLLSYKKIKEDIKEEKLNESAISDYLQYVSYHDINHVALIIKTYYKDFPNNIIPLMDFITLFQYDKELLEDKETLDVIKKITLEYPIENILHNLNYNYTQYVKDLIQHYPDNSYVAKLNKKMIDAMNKTNLHCDFKGIYRVLLKDYREIIWDDFEKAFVNDEYYYFFLQIKDEIGSGFDFGVGPLFMVNDSRIKMMCKKYPDKAPCRIAEMIPIFDNNETRFSDWFLWLIDEYGEQEFVLSGLHANLNTFSWTGTVIPLLEKKKTCFEKIKKHKRLKVRKWVEKCLTEIEENLRQEFNAETYDRLHYE